MASNSKLFPCNYIPSSWSQTAQSFKVELVSYAWSCSQPQSNFWSLKSRNNFPVCYRNGDPWIPANFLNSVNSKSKSMISTGTLVFTMENVSSVKKSHLNFKVQTKTVSGQALIIGIPRFQQFFRMQSTCISSAWFETEQKFSFYKEIPYNNKQNFAVFFSVFFRISYEKKEMSRFQRNFQVSSTCIRVVGVPKFFLPYIQFQIHHSAQKNEKKLKNKIDQCQLENSVH